MFKGFEENGGLRHVIVQLEKEKDELNKTMEERSNLT